MKPQFIVVVLISIGFFLFQEIQSQSQNKRILPLLGNEIEPTSYSIKLRPILDPDEAPGAQWTAPGQVIIQIQALKSTNRIVINRHPNLTIHEDSVAVTASKYYDIAIRKQTYSAKDNFHTITLHHSLQAGTAYIISMDFTAPISSGTNGLYRVITKDSQGVEHRVALTDLEPSAARQVFPCFDEPRWKTPFTVSLGYKKQSYNTLSNSKKRITAEADPYLENWVWDHYETTVRMPTYLVAMVISNFVFVQAPGDPFRGRPVRVYGESRLISPNGNKYNGGANTAVSASARALAFIERKYKFPYEMPKMDIVAIPTASYSKSTVAMENWGLNTFRDTFIYFFNEEQSWADKKQIIGTVAHEAAHQWFGNLVTCRNWANLWLNEGLSAYVGNLALQATNPEWDEMRLMLWGNVQLALDYDIANDVSVHSEGATSAFVYEKPGSLIRMIEGFLGEKTLTQALINYLQKYAYESVVQDQLFEQLTIQGSREKKLPLNTTMKDIMDTWTLQPGFPLVRVTTANSHEISISQERFQPPDTRNYGRPLFYHVPIATAIEGGRLFANYTPKLWLTPRLHSALVTHDVYKWIIVNPDAMSYYRVLYDAHLTQLILNQLRVKRSAISGLSRSMLIDDYFVLAANGHIEITQALEMTTWIKNDEGIELDFIVWYSLLSRFTQTLSMFNAFNNGTHHSFANYLVPKLDEALGVLGWTQGSQDKGMLVLLRAKLLDWTCSLGSSQCFQVALDNTNFWMGNPNINLFAVDVRPSMYCAAIAKGGSRVFNFYLHKLESSPIGDFKTLRPTILAALTCAEDIIILRRLLGFAIDESSLIGQNSKDAAAVIVNVASKLVGKTIILQFLDENFSKLIAKFDGASFIAQVLTKLSTCFTKSSERATLQNFIQKRRRELSSERGTLEAAIQNVQDNMDWIAKNYNAIDAWFKDHV